MPRTRLNAPLAILLIAGSLLAALPLAVGQDDADREARRQETIESARQDGARRESRVRAPAGPTISLSFPGGTLQEYVTSLQKAAGPAPSNILVRGDVDAISISPAELREVSLYTSLRLISGDYRDDSDPRYMYAVSAAQLGDEDGAAFLVNVERGGQFAPPPTPTKREILVVSLKEMTTSLPGDPPEVVVPAETVLTAVEAAIGIAGSDDTRTDVKYHSESGLLMLAGELETLKAANEVVERMMRDVRERRDRAREIQRAQGLGNPEALEADLADQQAEARMAMVQMEAARAHAMDLERALAEAQKLAEAGAASSGEVRATESMLREAQASIEMQKIKAERAGQRAAQAEQAFQRAKAIAAGGGPDSELHALREENAMLRDRLADMEAQLRLLQDQLAALSKGGGAR